MSDRGEINGWACNGVANHRPGQIHCGRTTYAIHVDDGVTPMFLACRAEGVEPDKAECRGVGTSLMYPGERPVPAHVLDAIAWEWYRPIGRELVELNEGTADHVEKGGLLIRALTDQGRELVEALR